MPWNGSGVFSRLYSWVADANAGTDIIASRMDADTDDIAQGLMHCLTVNGESVPTANLPMANYRHTGASPGVAASDYVTVGQLLNGGGAFGSGFLPLSGGTLSGLLTVDGGRLVVSGNNYPAVAFNDTTLNNWLAMWSASGQFGWGTADSTGTPATAWMSLLAPGNLSVPGSITAGGGITAGGTLQAPTVHATSTLQVDGGGSVASNLSVGGTVTAGSVVTTGFQVNSNALIVGSLTVESSLAVSGNASAGGQVSGGSGVISGGLQAGNLTVNSNATVSGTLSAGTVTTSGFSAGTGQFTGSLTVDGNLGIGLGTQLTIGGNAIFFATSYPATDNGYEFGTAGNAWAGVEAYGFIQHSDARSKTDLAPLEADCLALVEAIRPQRFCWAEGADGAVHWGFTAQDVGTAMAAHGHEFGGHRVDAQGRERLAYNELLALLWRAVQQLNERIESVAR